MSRVLCLTALALAMGIEWSAYADEQVTGIGAPYWAMVETLTMSQFMSIADGTSGAELFAAGSSDEAWSKAIVVNSDTALSCCWVGDLAATTSTTGEVTDAGGTSGQGACFHIAAIGEQVHTRPDRQWMVRNSIPGYRTGLCDTAATAANNNETLYAPCDADADCASPYGGGSCDTTPSQTLADSAGIFLRCIPDTGTSIVKVRKEYVRK